MNGLRFAPGSHSSPSSKAWGFLADFINHMSLKNNYKELSKKLGGHYTLIKKGIKRGWIDSIMQGSDIGVSKAYEIAKVLGVTMEELLTGNYEEKKVYSPDKQKYIDKLIEILNGNDDQKKNAIITILDNLKRDAWNDSLKKQQAG